MKKYRLAWVLLLTAVIGVDVLAIRELYRLGEWEQKEIAEIFGICTRTLYDVTRESINWNIYR